MIQEVVIEVVIYLIVGAFAGFVRAVVTGKGLIALPQVETINGKKYLNLGFISAMLIGALAGTLAPYALGVNAVISAMAGYVGEDLIENLIERAMGYPE